MPNRPLRVRDPIHGFIPYSAEEGKLIATPAVQRLRGIKQLAMTGLVYPGAIHSRFEHSLGVMHLAGRIARQVGVQEDSREYRWLRLAAVLHDIGHLPFSHAGEAAMVWLSRNFADAGEEAHEQITAALIEHDPAIGAVLTSERDRNGVLDILEKGRNRRISTPPEPLLWQIISGPLDADKLDYLLRDSLMAGVKYGVFDVDRVIDACVSHGPRGDRHLLIRKEDVTCVEQAILARYYITEQVYRHRVRRVSDAMLREAIWHAASRNSNLGRRIRNLFRIKPADPEWRSAFLASRDDLLLADLVHMPDGQPCWELATRLKDRRLLKQVFECKLGPPDIPSTAWAERLVKEPNVQIEVKKKLASALKAEPHLVIVDIRSRSNPLHRDPYAPLEEEIRVLDENGVDQRLGDSPGSLSDSAKVKEEERLCVYAAADTASAAQRGSKQRAVRNALLTACKEASK